jgi:hypothetical protein
VKQFFAAPGKNYFDVFQTIAFTFFQQNRGGAASSMLSFPINWRLFFPSKAGQ